MLILGRTLVTRAPPQALRRGVRVGGCGCGRTAAAAAVMAELGMVTHNGDLTDATWPPHIAEERALLFPKLAELGRAYRDPAVAQALARLEDDHRVYLALLDEGLPLPPWPESAHSTADHAALEDLLVATYAAPLRLMARGMTAEQAKVRVSLAPRAAVATAGSTGIAFAPKGGAAPHSAAAPAHRASWAPWLLATAAGAAGWWLFGPLAGVAALGGTVATTKLVGALSAKPPAHPVLPPAVRTGPPTDDNAPDPAAQSLPDVRVLLDGADAAAAASTAADAASQAALKSQNAEAKAAYKGLTKKLGDYVGAGDMASSWGGLLVDVALAIGNAVKAFSGDPAKEANTPEQRERLKRAMAEMIALGFPPPGLGFEMWGASQLADETEVTLRQVRDVDWKKDNDHGCVWTFRRPNPDDPTNVLDYSPVARDLGRSIVVAINNKTYGPRALAMFMEAAKRTGGMLHDRYYNARPGTGDSKHAAWDLKPGELLVAYAGAARYGMSEEKAREVVANALATFKTRWRWVDPGVPDGPGANVGCNEVAFRMVDAWMALQGYAASHGLYDGARWASRDYQPVVSP